MPKTFSQANRQGKLHSPYGEDGLLLTHFNGVDAVDELFEYHVEAISEEAPVDFDKALGEHLTVEIESIAHGPHFFDGILTEAEWIGEGEGGYLHRLVLRPWLWLASNRRNQRIFNEKSAEDIINEVLGKYGKSLEISASGMSEPLEYTVQFGETDLDFIRRLASRFGASFHFQHEKGEHKLVFTDSHDGFKKIKGDNRKFMSVIGQNVSEEEHFSTFSTRRRLTPGKVVLKDYNFKTSTKAMDGDHAGDGAHSNADLEYYDYPGNHLDQAAGKKIARIRMLQLRSADKHFFAEGDVISLAAGQRVTLKDHPDSNLTDKEYLTLRTITEFTAESYISGGTGGRNDSFSAHYEFVETSVPYLPPVIATTRKMAGVQVAKVVGAGEIDCDEFGRILVAFPWDMGGGQSMRCRVSQSWAGSSWGSIYIPRVGMEVVVQFVDNDVDRPLVTGCVYNDANMPPFGLPGKKNISGFKSNSTEGGGGYNEYVMDDTKGNELIRVHAQYDMDTTILHDERRSVGVNRSKSIGVNETNTIGKDRTTEIGKDETLTIGNDRTTTILANEIRSVAGNETETVAAHSMTSIGGNKGDTIGANHVVTVGGHRAVTVGGAIATTIGAVSALNIGGASEIGVGGDQVTIVGGDQTINTGGKEDHDVGSVLTITAGDKIVLQVGGSSIEITASAIEISSLDVTVKAAKVMTTSGGAMAEHTSGGTLDVKATLVKINS